MGWREKLLLCSFFVSICRCPGIKCGPVNATDVSGLNGDNSTPFESTTKDCSDLQKDLEEMKIKCKDSFKIAKDNIDGLKTQLYDLFKQLDTTNIPAKDVLVILQKIIDLQELDVELHTERDVKKTADLEARQRESKKDLVDMMKEYSRNVKIVKRAAGLKISTEPLKNNMATSTLLNELKKYLEDKIKQPGKQDGMSQQVLQIVKMQMAAMDLMTQTSEKYKRQTQIDVINTKLKDRNDLLKDLMEDRIDAKDETAKYDKHIAALEKEIKDLDAEMSAINQTLLQLDDQIKDANARKKEIMESIAKLKGKDKLISRILALQFEYMEAVKSAHGQMKAHEYQITDLQAQLEKEQDRNTYLRVDNHNLRKHLSDWKQECTDMMEIYINIETDLTAQIGQMSDSTSKNTLRIISLGMEIDQIEKQIKAVSSNDNLKEKLDRKIKEQNNLMEDLKKNQRNSDKILQVISQMEDIWRLQSEDPDDFNKISDLQKNLLNLIAELDDNDPTKPMLKIMALQSDVTWIIEMLKTVTDQIEMKKTDLQRKLKNTENLLNEKIKELEAGTTNSSQLEKEIAALKKEVTTLEIQIDDADKMTKQNKEDLEEQLRQHTKELNNATKELKEKDAKIAKQFLKINTLLDEMKDMKQQMQETEARVNARIAGLQDNLLKKEEENSRIQEENKKLKRDLKKTAECPELKDQYEKMQVKYEETVSELNSTVLQKVFFLKILIDEVENLDKQLTEGTSDSEDLRNKLEEKRKELAEAEQKLKAEGDVSAKTLTILQLLTEIWKRQENPTEENLAKIRNLEAKLQGLLTKLETSGEKGLDLAVKMISIKESMSRLKKAQDKMQEQYTAEINGLKKAIDDKEKEIAVLKANCGPSDQLKERIKQLEKEATESRNKSIKLQEEAKKKITSIQEQLTTKSKQLANAENKLQETSAKNADLIKRLNNLNDDLKKVTEQKKDSLKKAQEEISELKKLSEDQRKEIIKQDVKLREKNKTISTVQRERGLVKDELEKQKKKTNELETQLKTKKQQLANTEGVLKKMKDENDALVLKQDELNDNLRNLTDKKNNLQKHVSELNKKFQRQEEDLVEKERKLKQKDEDVSTLQKERDNSKAELEKEKNKYDKAINENKNLREILTKTKEEAEKLRKEEKEKLKPVSEWPRLDRKTAHRRLVLSEDEREARTSLKPQPVPNNPERYDTAIAALGRDGFDSGRHYWEVEVAGRNCYVVGVARASAQRKGLIHYSPKGGYWVILRKRDGRHVALADTQVLLKIGETTKIGVLVDFNSKMIKFYDVDKKRSVCRFTDIEFLETVYPYIESCSDSDINDPPLILKKAQSTDWIKQ
ncbi:titin homolog isoform X2 [Triplophysa dalaica]|uniref:titin homolog isoform X2 n=1 Tax=Triplophysa dalaica TaxID=1582913 RepID=UPI0024E040D3|nr:titin homolog isoform X2 [Triplophysa dalaica]